MIVLLAGCSQQPADQAAGAQLERAAIAAGVVRDPAAGLAGLYARDTDRLCVVPVGKDLRIGASIDYGDGQRCSATGTVTRADEALRVDFGRGCGFDARLAGDTIVFPGRLPAACDRLCTERASLTALEVDLQSDAIAEAAVLRDARGRSLCGR